MVKVSFLLLFCTLEYVYGKGRGTGSRSSKPINFKFETTRRYSEIYEGNDVELKGVGVEFHGLLALLPKEAKPAL